MRIPEKLMMTSETAKTSQLGQLVHTELGVSVRMRLIHSLVVCTYQQFKATECLG